MVQHLTIQEEVVDYYCPACNIYHKIWEKCKSEDTEIEHGYQKRRK